jgi:hypothetical protein
MQIKAAKKAIALLMKAGRRSLKSLNLKKKTAFAWICDKLLAVLFIKQALKAAKSLSHIQA